VNPETGLPFSAGTMKMRLLKRLKCTQKFEKLAWASGARLVAGVDEVGRGCLFGPVVAAAVILEPDYRIKGLRDSKLIDRETREKLAERIKQHAIAYAVAAVDVGRIDQLNIYWASLLAMREAVAQLAPAPDHLLVDAVRVDWGAFHFNCGSFDYRQGASRRDDPPLGPGLSGIRSGVQQGLPFAQTPGGAARAWANASAPAVVCSGLDVP
jgi:hypothetical protein